MKVSLVIPAWNASATVAETLLSVSAQTRPPDEVVLVDDGSDDDTDAVARAAYPGIRVVSQARRGPPAAINRGIAETSGDFVCFLDADDLWPPDKTERQAEVLAGDAGCGGVLGQMEHFLCSSVSAEVARRFVVPEGRMPGWLPSAFMVRRSVLERMGPFAEELVLGAFIDWFDRARRVGVRLELLHETVLRRRVREGSLAHRSELRDRGYLEAARRALARRRASGERPG